MVYVFEHVIQLLENFGFFRVLLPWLLIFAIFYGILNKTKILGEQKNINAVVALAAAFFVVASTPIVDALNALIPSAAYLIVAALLLLMFMGFFVKPDVGGGLIENKWAMALLGIFVLLIFAGVIDYTSPAQIPVVHEVVQGFFGGGGGGAGAAAGGFSMSEEQWGLAGAVALMLFVVFGTMYYMVHAP